MRKILSVRKASLLLLLALCACSAAAVEPTGALVAASVAAVPVFGRTLPDMAYSAVTGKDCSMVRLEQGRSYCREVDPPLAPPMVCSRSLGEIDCWKNPEAFALMPRAVADAPAPTAEQEAYRTRRWPNLW